MSSNIELTQREKKALSDLVGDEIRAIVNPDLPYPDVVVKFWLPLLEKLGGES